MKVRVAGNADGPSRSLWLWCPGCDDAHRITIDHADGWTWDGNEDAPTISPSILVQYGDQPGDRRCHSFVRAGVWQFLADCTHGAASQHMPMVDLPDWLARE